MRRCGWGAVSVEVDGSVTARARGPLPGWYQSVPAAETHAFLMVLRNAAPPVAYCTDGMIVKNTYEKGPGSLDVSHPVGPAWAQVWSRVVDIGPT